MRVHSMGLIGGLGLALLTGCAEMQSGGSASAMAKPTPAQGYNIHVMAPHKFDDGTVHGPYHHYCTPISSKIIQLFIV